MLLRVRGNNMKKFKIVSIFVVCLCMFMGCKNNDSDDRESSTYRENSDTEANNEQQLDESETFDFANGSVGYDIYDTTWENEVYEYTGDELKISFDISTMPVSTEFSLLVFIDGTLTPYYSSENSDIMDIQVFKTEKGEKKKSYTIFFEPLSGVKGEEYTLTVLLLDNPNYMLKDTSFLSFLPNHSIMEISKKTLVYNCETVENTDVCANYDVRDLSKEVENIFANDYSEGGNMLNEMIYYMFSSQSFDDNPKAESISLFSIDKNEKLKIYIPFLGKDGEYRVSLYINYQLVPAFDGKNYLDVTVERDKYTEKVVELDVSNYEGLNHIELMVVDKNGGYVTKQGPILLEILE